MLNNAFSSEILSGHHNEYVKCNLNPVGKAEKGSLN